MSEPSTGRIYDLWARAYDGTFGRLVHKRQIRAIRELRAAPGDRVLDLGIGTGMSLLDYDPGLRVTGLDLSAGMLAKARDKVGARGFTHVGLVQGNALATPFADATFDQVMISHTISVVSQPNALLHEARRLVRPGGRVVVLNHFRSPLPVVGTLERVLNPLFVKIGWRSDLTLEECTQGVDLRQLYRFKLSAADLWQIVVFVRPPAPGRAGAAARPAV